MKDIQGKLIGKGMKIGIVLARFNEFIGSKLLSGAEDALIRHGVDEDDIEVAWVPGAYEIPLVAKKLATSEKYDAVICPRTSSPSVPWNTAGPTFSRISSHIH